MLRRIIILIVAWIFIPFLALLALSDTLFIIFLVFVMSAYSAAKKRREQEWNEAIEAIMEQVHKDEPMWTVLQDFDSPRDPDAIQLAIDMHYGTVHVRPANEEEWQMVGVDMPEFLPPPEETPHG